MFPQHEIRVNPLAFKNKILDFINTFPTAIFLDSNPEVANAIPITGTRFSYIAAAGVIDEIKAPHSQLEQLQSFVDKHRESGNWIFGYFTYDVKNELEQLESSNPDFTGFPLFHFFAAGHILLASDEVITVLSADPETTWNMILQSEDSAPKEDHRGDMQIAYVPERDSYCEVIKNLLFHIQQGDIYEVNYCHEVKAKTTGLNPLDVYRKLIQISPNPFACYYRVDGRHLMCASPERFMAKRGDMLLTQPMKGTAARGGSEKEDIFKLNSLANSEKERSENIMIVDLARNDLSKVAEKGSVKVEELCGVYSFARAHQMISTVSCRLKNHTTFIEIVRALFPMGSMTGAPKINAMKIIDDMEHFRRSLFSGSVGFISPEGDFDFNVVIRSIQYNEKNGNVSIAAGGAITAASIPEKEYEETLIKLAPQMEALGVNFELLKEFTNGSIA